MLFKSSGKVKQLTMVCGVLVIKYESSGTTKVRGLKISFNNVSKFNLILALVEYLEAVFMLKEPNSNKSISVYYLTRFIV